MQFKILAFVFVAKIQYCMHVLMKNCKTVVIYSTCTVYSKTVCFSVWTYSRVYNLIKCIIIIIYKCCTEILLYNSNKSILDVYIFML